MGVVVSMAGFIPWEERAIRQIMKNNSGFSTLRSSQQEGEEHQGDRSLCGTLRQLGNPHSESLFPSAIKGESD